MICPNYNDPIFKDWVRLFDNDEAIVERLWLLYGGNLPKVSRNLKFTEKDLGYKELSKEEKQLFKPVKVLLDNKISRKFLGFSESETQQIMSGFNQSALKHMIAYEPRALKFDSTNITKYINNHVNSFIKELSVLNDKLTPKAVANRKKLVAALQTDEGKLNFTLSYIDYLNSIKGGLFEDGIDTSDIEDIIINNKGEDAKTKDTAYDQDASKFSVKDSAPAVVKLVLASIPEFKRVINDKGEVVNEVVLSETLGYALSTDYSQLFNFIANNLVGINPDAESLKNKLTELIAIKPEIRLLVESRLSMNPKFTDRYNTKDNQTLITNFIQTFSKSKPEYLLNLIKSDGKIIFLDSNNSGLQEKIYEKWRANFYRQHGTFTPTEGIMKTISDKYEIAQAIQKIITNSKDKVVVANAKRNFVLEVTKVINLLGIHFDNLEPLLANDVIANNKETTILSLLGNLINNNDLTKGLYDSQDKFVKMKLNDLLEVAAQFSQEIIELQHINPENETVYGVNLNTYMTILFNGLNNTIKKYNTVDKRIEALKLEFPFLYTPFLANSKLRKMLESGNTVRISISEGIKQDKPFEDGVHFRDVSNPDKLAVMLNDGLKGIYSYLRASDRSTENKLSIIKSDGKTRVKYVKDINEAKDAFFGYLKDEIMTANLLVTQDLGNDIEYYSKNARSLRIFEKIITNPLVKAKIAELIKLDGLTETQLSKELNNSFYKDAIAADISKWFTKVIEDTTKAIKDEGLVNPKTIYKDGVPEYNLSGISSEILADYDVTKDDLFKEKDPLNLDGIKELISDYVANQTVAYIENIKFITGDLALFKTLADFTKRTGMFNGTKAVSRIGKDWEDFKNANYPRVDIKVEDRDSINTIVLKDIVTSFSAKYLQSLKETFIAHFKSEGFTSEQAEERAEEIVQKYTKNNVADAQGFITMDEYREIKLNEGTWGDIHEDLYNKLINGETVNPKDIAAYFNVLKTQYAGPMNYEGLMVTTGYKHSLFPLLPNLIYDREISGIKDFLKTNKIGIVQFESATKFGIKKNKDGKLNTLYDEKGNLITKGFSIQAISYRYFGIQQKIDDKIGKTIKGGTQLRKNILLNLYNDGELTNPAIKDKVDRYHELQSELVIDPLNNLLKKLGATKNNRYSIDERRILTELLLRQAKDRNSSNNILVSMEALSHNMAYIDSIHQNGKVGQVLLAYLRNNSINEKRSGSGRVQVSNVGLRKFNKDKSGFKDDLLFYTVSKATGETLPFEIELAITPALQKLISKDKFKDLDELNEEVEMINEEYRKWHENKSNKGKTMPEFSDKISIKLLKGLGFRIPNQALASSDLYIVKRFLPKEASESIFVPVGLTTKTGSDFDVDKFYTYDPNFIMDAYGTPQYLDNSFTAADFEKEYSTKKGYSADEDKLILDIFGEESDSSLEDHVNKRLIQQKQNELLQIMMDLMKMPENFTQLLTPTDAELLKEYASEVNASKGISKNINYDDIIKPVYNLMLAKYFLTGKSNIGIVANHQANHVICQIAGIYIANNGEKSDIFFDHNSNKDGFPTLGGKLTIGNYYISDLIQQFLSAYVDIAKEPFIFDLNAGKETVSVIMYMLRLGADPKWVANFITQPIIIDYIKAKETNSSEINQMADLDKSKANLIVDFMTKNNLPTLKQELLYYINSSLLRNKNATDVRGITEYKKATEFKPNVLTKLSKNFSIAELQGMQKAKIDGNKQQAIILQHFLEYERQADFLNTFIRVSHPDTDNLKDINDMMQLAEERRELWNSGYFGNLQNLDKTFLKGFFQAQGIIESLVKKLYISTGAKIQADLKDFKAALKRVNFGRSATLNNLIDNDLRDYMLQNAKDSFFNSKANFFLFDKKNSNNLPRTISRIQSELKHPLHNNLIIQNLIPDFSRETQDNLKIFNKRLNKYDDDLLTKSFNEIRSYNRQLADTMIKFAIIQSGSNESNISWVSKLPSELINPLKIFALYESNLNPINAEQFKKLFILRHPELLPKLKGWGLKRKEQLDIIKEFKIGTTKDDGKVVVAASAYDWNTKKWQIKWAIESVNMVSGKKEYNFLGNIDTKGDGRYFTDWAMEGNIVKEAVKPVFTAQEAEIIPTEISGLSFFKDLAPYKEGIDFQEEPTTGYKQRTINNAKADATIAIAVDFNSAGEKLTKTSVLGQNKKYIPIDANTLTVTKERVDKIVEQLNSVNAKTLNIAGNGIYTMKGKYTQKQIDDFTYDLLNQALNSPNLKTKIESIRSGGQTGFDEAGAKAGIKLGLPTIILAPKGWTFRNINGQDISNEQQFKDRFIEQPINKEIKPNEVTKFFETKFNLPVEYDNTLLTNIGGYVKNGKVYLNPNINPDKLNEVIIEEYTHIITTKLEKEHPEIFEGLFNDLINTPEYKELRDKAIAKVNSLYPELTKNEVEKLLNKGIEQQNQVNYTLKSINILQTPKADELFRKGDKNNWDIDKILNELAISKEQKELIKSFNTRNREEILTSLLSQYSYAIEINTAKVKKEKTNLGTEILPYGKKEDETTSYYSNLTVPGGTNYTENEISTPLIAPSIKGHAQFATENGIGWFRSDDKISEQKKEFSDLLNKNKVEDAEKLDALRKTKDLPTKTRRILEVQSDLFQKGRDRKDLVTPFIPNAVFSFENNNYDIKVGILRGQSYQRFLKNGVDISIDEYRKAQEDYQAQNPKENQFLQLLNKDNNWVTFFVKSIIQDSAKKGYEKVLFPSGNTASKVEGHSTLEEFKKQKEARIKQLEEDIKQEIKPINNKYVLYNYDEGFSEESFNSLAEAVEFQKRNSGWYFKEEDEGFANRGHKISEIKTLKQELKRVETEGLAALKPIYNFYENTVANILKKQGYTPNQVTDEYGNTWNEITITEKQRQELILLSKLTGEIDNSKTQLPAKITQSFKHEVLGQATAMATKGKVSSGLAKIANDILEWIKNTLSKIGFRNVNTIKTFKDLKQVFEDNNIRIDLNQPTEIKPKIDSSKDNEKTPIEGLNERLESYGNTKLILSDNFYEGIRPKGRLNFLKSSLSQVADNLQILKDLKLDEFDFLSKEDKNRLDNLRPKVIEFSKLNMAISSELTRTVVAEKKYAQLSNEIINEFVSIMGKHIQEQLSKTISSSQKLTQEQPIVKETKVPTQEEVNSDMDEYEAQQKLNPERGFINEDNESPDPPGFNDDVTDEDIDEFKKRCK